MRGFLRSLSLVAAILVCGMNTLAHADDTSSLEERMSYKDFTKFGLDKLSPDQLRGLNEWLAAHGGACAPGAGTSPMSSSPTSGHSGRIVSRLVGEFTGWQQGTVLTLANGQKWEVRDDEPLIAGPEQSPEVTVDPGLIGGWTLSVSGHSEIAHVIPAGH